ncbi:MAG: glycosyltransferase family 39 protein [Rhodospirillaceae bacterium]|nr:glycosyltransferase family 39 protein [Rhodospirillaceae bacterium]
MKFLDRHTLGLIGLWAAAVGVALSVRPALPVDETRYLAVAWDMWLESHYLVPYLNGEPYSHKPPLLFWLMTAGWHVFGVNEWWPKLVAPLFGLGCLLLTTGLSRALWPDDKETSTLAPVLLFGCVFWTVFTTATMFDMLLAFFALAALTGVIKAWRGDFWRGMALAGLAMGFGVLAKGPAILLHVLPVALSVPFWGPYLAGSPAGVGRKRWYLGVGCAVVLAAAVGLAWAVPAAISGGEAYRDAIFWGQSAGRLVNSFAHARPFWWYAAVLPGLVLPWLIWPPLWRAFKRLPEVFGDGGVRVCIVWMATAFVIFSLASGKQLHYLLPEFPALALLAARLINIRNADGMPGCRFDALPAWVMVAIGALILALPVLPLSSRGATIAGEANTLWGGLVLLLGVGVAWKSAGAALNVRAMQLSALSAGLVVVVYMALAPVLSERYDVGPLARQIKKYHDAGKLVANFGKYHGQYHFVGRLTKPVPVMGLSAIDEAAFLGPNPDGYVIAYYKKIPKTAVPDFVFTFRHRFAVIWPAKTVIAHPALPRRD